MTILQQLVHTLSHASNPQFAVPSPEKGSSMSVKDNHLKKFTYLIKILELEACCMESHIRVADPNNSVCAMMMLMMMKPVHVVLYMNSFERICYICYEAGNCSDKHSLFSVLKDSG